VFENDLQTVFLIPVAITFKQHINRLIAIAAAANQRLIAELNVLPDIRWFGNLYAGLAFGFRQARPIEVIVENRGFCGLQRALLSVMKLLIASEKSCGCGSAS
jgi:hypothetical protein